jgi:hypothetical protein
LAHQRSMIASQDIKPGEYLVGTRAEDGTTRPFATLWLWPATAGSQSVGQWILEIDRSNLVQTGLDEDGWAEMLGRLQLHPISIAPDFLAKLRSDEPIAIIADTSALHSGAALQVCTLRQGKPTLFAVPDQAYMEIHSQRETLTVGDRASKRVKTNIGMFMAIRHIGRLRAAGHVIHFARPPEAMVRYLGSDRGAASGDENSADQSGPKAPGYVRDRLVIEAARALHRSAPHLPLHVLTADVKLALQSHLEQFPSGLCAVPKLPETLRYGSPWILPYTLRVVRIHAADLLAELAWTLGSVYLQANESAEATEWRLPDTSNDAARFLLRAAVLQPTKFRASRVAMLVADTASVTNVPKRTPTAQSLVDAMVHLVVNGVQSQGFAEISPFLVAFGWAENAGAGIVPTPAGNDAAQKWIALNSSDVLGWCDWMDLAARAARNASTIRDALNIVTARSGITRDSDVAKKLAVSDETARKLLVFASVFGVIVRLGGKIWLPTTSEDNENTVLDAVKRVAAKSRGSAAPAERVFTDLLTHSPLTLPMFRKAVYRLVERGLIERDRGTVRNPPKSAGETPVKLRTIAPGEGGTVMALDVDIGHGDFLIPGVTMQDLVLRGEQS